jgi:hypothetical protein
LFTVKEAVSIPWSLVWRNLTGHFRSLDQEQLELEETISKLKEK